jgi:two-component system invasion response regulator UvrY
MPKAETSDRKIASVGAAMQPAGRRFLIVDDFAMVRRGIAEILSEGIDGAVIGEAGTSQEALDAIWKGPWDVVLLDINLPGRSGLETLREIREIRPHLPVLIISVQTEEQVAVRSLRAGAAGFLHKNAEPDELIEAIRKILGGGKYITASLAERLLNELSSDSSRPAHEILSDREYQVMRLIASGLTVGDIAAQLCLSVKTVSTYRTRILEKLNFKNNAELTRYAIERGLTD